MYQDWRPSVEKTDVVGAMEAIEGASSRGGAVCGRLFGFNGFIFLYSFLCLCGIIACVCVWCVRDSSVGVIGIMVDALVVRIGIKVNLRKKI